LDIEEELWSYSDRCKQNIYGNLSRGWSIFHVTLHWFSYWETSHTSFLDDFVLQWRL
jgi:hypothetical protein